VLAELYGQKGVEPCLDPYVRFE